MGNPPQPVSEPDPGWPFSSPRPGVLCERASQQQCAARGPVRRRTSGWTEPACSTHLSSSPRKLFPMMTTLESASADQLLHRRLLYSAVPQCGM